MCNSPAELFGGPAEGFVEVSGGGLDRVAMHGLIDASIGGAIQHSSVTTKCCEGD